MHALFYSGFLEDPLTWLVLAVAAGWSLRPGRADADPRVARAPARGGAAADVSAPAGSTGERLGRLEALALLALLLAHRDRALPELGSDPGPSGRAR